MPTTTEIVGDSLLLNDSGDSLIINDDGDVLLLNVFTRFIQGTERRSRIDEDEEAVVIAVLLASEAM